MTTLDLPSLDEIDRELTRRSFREFVPLAWPIIEPATPFVDNWHIGAICEHLQAVHDGQIQNLLINVPPGHMKSLLVSVFFPAWLWGPGGCPDWRMIFASYAQNLAVRDSMKTRAVIESSWFQSLFSPDWELCDDHNSKSSFANTASGFRMCAGVGGQSTGHRGDLLVVDDPLNAKEQQSEAVREEVLFWWDQAFANRLNNLRTGRRIIIMQRLHVKDLAGHVLEREPERWTHLRLPSLFEPERRCVTSIGWSDPRKDSGELLFPKMFPAEIIESEKKRLRPMGFSGQHQQQPTPDEGIKFKRQWFRYFEDSGEFYTLHTPGGIPKRYLKTLCSRYATCDTAFSTKQHADYTAIGIWALTPDKDLLLVEMRRERMEDPEVERTIRNVIRRRRPVHRRRGANKTARRCFSV